MATAAILKNQKILISSQLIDRFWRNLAGWVGPDDDRHAVERPSGAEARDAADPGGAVHRRQRRADRHHAAPQEPAQLGDEPARGVAGAVRPADRARRRAAGRQRRARPLRTFAVRLPRRILPHRHAGTVYSLLAEDVLCGWRRPRWCVPDSVNRPVTFTFQPNRARQ